MDRSGIIYGVLILFFAKYVAVLALVLTMAAAAGTSAAGAREGLALRTALGLALWAHAAFVLSVLGVLRPVPLVLLAVVAIGGALWRGRYWRSGGPMGPMGPMGRMGTRGAALALCAVPLFALALYPPIAFDETLYHLEFVRTFAAEGTLRFVPELRFPVFPQLHELLCVPVFLLAGDVATHLVALAEVTVTAALLIAWGRHYHAGAGTLAAALFLGSPLVVQLATVLYVDAALTLFVVAGFYALDRERYAYAGLFLGTACSVKYLGGYFAVAALGIVLMRAAHRRRDLLRYAIACAAAALPTTVWLLASTRNPVFPSFGTSLWAPDLNPPMPLTDRLLATLRVVWDVTFSRERMNHQPPVTPLLGVLVLIAIAAAVRDTRARWIVLLSGGYLAAFSFLPQDSRYLMPLLPLVSIVAAVAIVRKTMGPMGQMGRMGRVTAVLAVLAVAPGMAYAGYRLLRQGVPPVADAQRRAWLTERIPEYRALLRAGTDRIYVCRAEQLKSLAGGPLLGDFAGPYSYARILDGAATTRTIAARLRPLDVRYFLVARRDCTPPFANGGMHLVYEDPQAQLWEVDVAHPTDNEQRATDNAPHT
jgi:hypothetical protein